MRAGKAACFAADVFFSARISNPHTRTAYAHQVSRFLAWCEDQGLELHQVTPGRAGASDGAAESPVLFIGSLLHSLGTTGEMVLGGIAVGRRPFHLRHPENARCLVQLAENKATGLNFLVRPFEQSVSSTLAFRVRLRKIPGPRAPFPSLLGCGLATKKTHGSDPALRRSTRIQFSRYRVRKRPLE